MPRLTSMPADSMEAATPAIDLLPRASTTLPTTPLLSSPDGRADDGRLDAAAVEVSSGGLLEPLLSLAAQPHTAREAPLLPLLPLLSRLLPLHYQRYGNGEHAGGALATSPLPGQRVVPSRLLAYPTAVSEERWAQLFGADKAPTQQVPLVGTATCLPACGGSRRHGEGFSKGLWQVLTKVWLGAQS